MLIRSCLKFGTDKYNSIRSITDHKESRHTPKFRTRYELLPEEPSEEVVPVKEMMLKEREEKLDELRQKQKLKEKKMNALGIRSFRQILDTEVTNKSVGDLFSSFKSEYKSTPKDESDFEDLFSEFFLSQSADVLKELEKNPDISNTLPLHDKLFFKGFTSSLPKMRTKGFRSLDEIKVAVFTNFFLLKYLKGDISDVRFSEKVGLGVKWAKDTEGVYNVTELNRTMEEYYDQYYTTSDASAESKGQADRYAGMSKSELISEFQSVLEMDKFLPKGPLVGKLLKRANTLLQIEFLFPSVAHQLDAFLKRQPHSVFNLGDYRIMMECLSKHDADVARADIETFLSQVFDSLNVHYSTDGVHNSWRDIFIHQEISSKYRLFINPILGSYMLGCGRDGKRNRRRELAFNQQNPYNMSVILETFKKFEKHDEYDILKEIFYSEEIVDQNSLLLMYRMNYVWSHIKLAEQFGNGGMESPRLFFWKNFL